jgi:hypothetical protein
LGVLFCIAGLLILFPDIRQHFPARATAFPESSPVEGSPTSPVQIPPPEAEPVSSAQPQGDEIPATATGAPTLLETPIRAGIFPTPYMPDGPRCAESCTPTGSAACIRIASMDPWSETTPVAYIDLDITSHATGQVWFHGNTGSEGATWLALPIEPHSFDITLSDYPDESSCSLIDISLPTIGCVSVWLQPSLPRGSSTCNYGSW